MTTPKGSRPDTMTLESGEHFTVDMTKMHVRAHCPFCSGEYRAGFFTSGEAFLVHTKPECERFVREDPLDFMIAARHADARRLPWLWN